MLISISGAIRVLGDASACLLAELIACAGHDLGNTLSRTDSYSST